MIRNAEALLGGIGAGQELVDVVLPVAVGIRSGFRATADERVDRTTATASSRSGVKKRRNANSTGA